MAITLHDITSYLKTDANVSTHSISFPATVNNGDLLICVFGYDENRGETWPGDWTNISASAMTSCSYSVRYHECDGTETGTFDVVLSGSERGAAAVFRISGHVDPGTQAPEMNVTEYSSATTTYTPPAITPTGGSKEYLFICWAINEAYGSVDTWPSGYINTGQEVGNVDFASTDVAWCTKIATATTETPGNFSLTGSETGGAGTIAIHPGETASSDVNLHGTGRGILRGIGRGIG